MKYIKKTKKTLKPVWQTESKGRPLTSLLDLLAAGSDDLIHELAADESLGAPLIDALLPGSLHLLLDESLQLLLPLLLLRHHACQVLPVTPVLLPQLNLPNAANRSSGSFCSHEGISDANAQFNWCLHLLLLELTVNCTDVYIFYNKHLDPGWHTILLVFTLSLLMHAVTP